MSNVDNSTLSTINNYWKMYCKYLENNDQVDIDYPNYKLKFK